MGCSISRLDDKEAVQLCKDRKCFISQAVQQRARFASGNLAYIQSMERVCSALREFFEGFEPQGVWLDSSMTSSSVGAKSFTLASIQVRPSSTIKVNYLKSGGSQVVSVQERPLSPEIVRVESYPCMHQSGMDGYFAMQVQSPPRNSSFVSYSPNREHNISPPSPQTSQWDAFWNPFSTLDYYSYLTRTSSDHIVMDDASSGLKKVREEGEIKTEKVFPEKGNEKEDQGNTETSCVKEEVIVEDVNEDEEDDETSKGKGEARTSQSQNDSKKELSGAQNQGLVEIDHQEKVVADGENKVDTTGFTVHIDHRPTKLAGVVKDLQEQFTIVCNSVKELSVLLQSSRAQNSSVSNELTATNMLNPVALFHSASSRAVKNEYHDGSSAFSDESCLFSNSHQSTLDRLYAWEKKLYKEVKNGERIRIAYEKKCMQLSSICDKQRDAIAADRIKAAVRDLRIKINMSIHSVDSVSKRIKTLWDDELLPQLSELLQGLARIWKVMQGCHESQKRILEEAKVLLARTHPKLDTKRRASMSITDLQSFAKLATNLEIEVRNWQACFEAWIGSQQCYIRAISSWLLRCVRADPDTSKLSFSPSWSSETPSIYELFIQWARFLDSSNEVPVLDEFDKFATGVGSLCPQQLQDDHRKFSGGPKKSGAGSSSELSRNMEVADTGEVEELMPFEKMTEVAMRVVCNGMFFVMSSLTEFATMSAGGYAELVKQWELSKRPRVSETLL